MDTGILVTQMNNGKIDTHIYCESCLKMTTTSIKGNGQPIFSRKIVCENCQKRIQAKTPDFYRTVHHGQYRRQFCVQCEKYRYERLNHKQVNTFPKYDESINWAKSKKEEGYFTSCICDEECESEWSEFFMVPPLKILAEELVLSGKGNDPYKNNAYRGYERFVEYTAPQVLEYEVKNSEKQYRLDFKYLTGYTIHLSKNEEKLWITPKGGKYIIVSPRKTENLNDVKYIYHRYEYNQSKQWFDYIDTIRDNFIELIKSLGIESKFEGWHGEIHENKRKTLMDNINQHLFSKYESERLELLELKDLTVLCRYPNVYHFWKMTNYTFNTPYEMYQILYNNERIMELYKQECSLHDFLDQYSLGYFTKGERKLIHDNPNGIELYSNVMRYISNVDERKNILILFDDLQTTTTKWKQSKYDIKTLQKTNKEFSRNILKLKKIFRQFLPSRKLKLVIEKFVIQVTKHFLNVKHLSISTRDDRQSLSMNNIVKNINNLTEDIIEQLNLLIEMECQNELKNVIHHYEKTNQSITNFENRINQSIMENYNFQNMTTSTDFEYSDKTKHIYNDKICDLNFRLAKSPSYLGLMSKIMKICVGYVSYYQNCIKADIGYIIHAYNNNIHICIHVDHHTGYILEVKTSNNQYIDTLGQETIEKVAEYQTRMSHRKREIET